MLRAGQNKYLGAAVLPQNLKGFAMECHDFVIILKQNIK